MATYCEASALGEGFGQRYRTPISGAWAMKRPTPTSMGKPNSAVARCELRANGLLRNPSARLPTGSSHMDKWYAFAKRTKCFKERLRKIRVYMFHKRLLQCLRDERRWLRRNPPHRRHAGLLAPRLVARRSEDCLLESRWCKHRGYLRGKRRWF